MTSQGRSHDLLLLSFVGSGAAALIYEVVWFQLIQLVVGSTAVSLGVVLGTFMGGMCIGSLALPRLVPAGVHPLRVYAALEVGIAAVALALLFAVPVLGNAYAALTAPGLPGIILRGLFCAALLLPPTILMGATLPAVARWVEATPRGVSWLGLFYAANIGGAVLGCLAAGFYLLRVHGVATATGTAVAINLAVAGIAFALSVRHAHRGAAVPGALPPGPRDRSVSTVHVGIALSGLTALGAEVVWTRSLSLALGPTVYTFSIILAVVLLGLGLGSGAGALVARTSQRPRVALGVCQLLLTATIAWAAHAIAVTVPHWPVDTSVDITPWAGFVRDFVRSAVAVLPAAILWGASMPLALAAVPWAGRDHARLVGGVYAANTIGAIVGAMAFSLAVIPWMGTQQAQRLLIIVAGVAAVLLLVRRSGRLWLGAALVPVALLTIGVPAVPAELVAYGRFAFSQHAPSRMLFVGEGRNSSVAVAESPNGVRTFHVAGKVEASTDPQDMRLQRMLSHFGALVHPNPRSVLVVGFGAGITAGTFLMYSGIERIVVVELEPIIPQRVGPFFTEQNLDLLNDPRVEIVYDDARHYVLTTHETFDIITSDPIHPWVKGSAALYSREYFEMVRRHLNPGGVVTQWLPLYETSVDAVRSEVATFLSVFGGATLWGSRTGPGGGYDLVMLGQADSTRVDIGALQRRVTQPSYLPVVRSLVESGMGSAVDLFSTFVGDGVSLAPALDGAELNLDRNFRVQYLAGMAANLTNHDEIFAGLVAQRRFPDALFVAPAAWKDSLRVALGRIR